MGDVPPAAPTSPLGFPIPPPPKGPAPSPPSPELPPNAPPPPKGPAPSPPRSSPLTDPSGTEHQVTAVSGDSLQGERTERTGTGCFQRLRSQWVSGKKSAFNAMKSLGDSVTQKWDASASKVSAIDEAVRGRSGPAQIFNAKLSDNEKKSFLNRMEGCKELGVFAYGPNDTVIVEYDSAADFGKLDVPLKGRGFLDIYTKWGAIRVNEQLYKDLERVALEVEIPKLVEGKMQRKLVTLDPTEWRGKWEGEADEKVVLQACALQDCIIENLRHYHPPMPEGMSEDELVFILMSLAVSQGFSAPPNIALLTHLQMLSERREGVLLLVDERLRSNQIIIDSGGVRARFIFPCSLRDEDKKVFAYTHALVDIVFDPATSSIRSEVQVPKFTFLPSPMEDARYEAMLKKTTVSPPPPKEEECSPRVKGIEWSFSKSRPLKLRGKSIVLLRKAKEIIQGLNDASDKEIPGSDGMRQFSVAYSVADEGGLVKEKNIAVNARAYADLEHMTVDMREKGEDQCTVAPEDFSGEGVDPTQLKARHLALLNETILRTLDKYPALQGQGKEALRAGLTEKIINLLPLDIEGDPSTLPGVSKQQIQKSEALKQRVGEKITGISFAHLDDKDPTKERPLELGKEAPEAERSLDFGEDCVVLRQSVPLAAVNQFDQIVADASFIQETKISLIDGTILGRTASSTPFRPRNPDGTIAKGVKKRELPPPQEPQFVKPEEGAPGEAFKSEFKYDKLKFNEKF